MQFYSLRKPECCRPCRPIHKSTLAFKSSIHISAILTLSIILIATVKETSATYFLSRAYLPVKNEISKTNLCLTPGCIRAAAKIFDSLDLSVAPCDDFYHFACGKYIKETNIPDDKVSVNTFSIIGDKLQEQLRTIFSEPVGEFELAPFRLAKEIFTACMNKSLIEERGIEPMVKLHKSLGGWPVIEGDNWDEQAWNWVKSVKDFRNVGYSTDYILDFSTGIDLKNTTRRIVDIDQSTLGLSREYLIKGHDDPIVKAYYSYMVDIAVLYGADRSRAEKEMLDSLNFEITLANISLPKEERRDASALYNPLPLTELQKEYPYVAWLAYINDILPEEVQIDDNEVIIVSVKSFFKDLERILKETPKRTMANYVMWRITEASSLFLTENLRKRQLKYSTEVSGAQDLEPRWKECVDITTSGVPISVAALYIRQFFREDAKKAAIEMVQNIREVFENILQEVEWMDTITRAQALDKVKAIVTHIGYPDELMDDRKLVGYYDGLEIDSNKYLESILRLNKFNMDKIYLKLREPVNKTDWTTHSKSAVVNAFYSPIENSIQFPAGILQGAFFAADRPRYMNYGAIGSIIGHEITHGFDDQGRQFDENGNLVDWWQSDTKEAYLEKARCIIDQYGNFTEPNVKLNLNGINTQGENIADNGGLKEAYIAYTQWVAKNGEEPRLPGLDYSPDQLFWIAAAHNWCAVSRPEATKIRIITGYHSPEQFRVLGPFSNMVEFSKSFNCPLHSNMNPAEKCKVW